MAKFIIDYNFLKNIADIHKADIEEVIKKSYMETVPWRMIKRDRDARRITLECPDCKTLSEFEEYGYTRTRECPACHKKVYRTFTGGKETRSISLRFAIEEYIEETGETGILLGMFESECSIDYEDGGKISISEPVVCELGFCGPDKKYIFYATGIKTTAKLINVFCGSHTYIEIGEPVREMFSIPAETKDYTNILRSLENYYVGLRRDASGKTKKEPKIDTVPVVKIPHDGYLALESRVADYTAGKTFGLLKCMECGCVIDVEIKPDEEYKCPSCGCSKLFSDMPFRECFVTVNPEDKEQILIYSQTRDTEKGYVLENIVGIKNGKIKGYDDKGNPSRFTMSGARYIYPNFVFDKIPELAHTGVELLPTGNAGELVSYLAAWQKNPKLESLVKQGFGTVIRQMFSKYGDSDVGLNFSGTTDEEILGLSNALIRGIKKASADEPVERKRFVIYKALYKLDNTMTSEIANWFSEQDFNISDIERAGRINSKFGISFKRISEYLEHARISQCITPSSGIYEWMDYLLAAQNIGVDLTDRKAKYPSSLRLEHDRTIFKAGIIKEKEKEDEFAEAISKYKDIAYEGKDFFVKVPNDLKELFEEGRKLSHCVGTYGDSITKGHCYILFLREKARPDKPFYTVEVTRDKRIAQIRGFGDTAHVTPEVRAFVNEWVKKKHLIRS